MKRLFDFLVSLTGLIIASPILLVVAFAVWLQDRHSPLYIAPRVGKDEKVFQMVKLRSMIVDAAASKVDSTAKGDRRITPVGALIRRFKLDELMQLWNVLIGDMSLVGPRPNVKRETDLYTTVEKKLLSVRPGITDFASVVFADEGDILEGHQDPDLAYNQLIRPWKSRLSLHYIDHQSLRLDLKLIMATAVAIVSRQAALNWIVRELCHTEAPHELIQAASREKALVPHPPPGSDHVTISRDPV